MSTVASSTLSDQQPSSTPKRKSAKEERVNAALLDAIYMHSDSQGRWKKLIDEGAHDNQIWHGLLREFGGGGSSQTEGGDPYAFQGGSGADQPKFWFSQGTHYTNEKPTLAGARLVKRVRELLQIPSTTPEDRLKQKLQDEYEVKRQEHYQVISDSVQSILAIDSLDALAQAREGVRARGRALSKMGIDPDGDDWNAELWRHQMDAIITRERQLKEIAQLAEADESNGSHSIAENIAALDDTAANGDGVPEGSALAVSGDAAGGSESNAEGHEFKPTTARNGRCVDCNKPRATKEHRAFAAQQKAREKAGKPKREARFWREQASGMTGGIAKKLRPYDTPGRKTLRKIEEYEARIKDGLQDQQWQETLINIADLVDEGQLPPVLFGLTNAYQVRQLMGSGRFDYAPSNMGPTIKTVEDLKAAHKALKPYVPELHDDPNLDPRDGTKWARDLSAEGDDGGSQADDSDGSSIAEAGEASSLPEWHEYFEQTPGEGCIVGCGKPEDDPIHRDPEISEQRKRAILSALENDQRERWPRLSELEDRSIPTEKELIESQALGHEYEEAYERAVEALDGDSDAVQEVRDRIERPDLYEKTPRPNQDTPEQSSTPVIETAPVGAPRTFQTEIEVELSDGDYKRLAREAAFKNLQIEELQAEKDRTVAEYKKKIGGLEEERDEIMRTIRRGHALLDLEVYEHRDYDRKVVETVRADNHAVVASRAMTTRELQQPLPSL